MSRPDTPADPLRLSEILAAFSYALDLTEGKPLGHAARTCLIGIRLAERLGLSTEDRSSLFCALLLKDAGCSSNAARLCLLFQADDRSLKHQHKLIDWTRPLPALQYALTHTAPNAGPLRRLAGLVSPGERFVLLGASGSGKTSLLRTLAGLARPAAGRVLVTGRDVTDLPCEQRDMVYLHQTPVLFPHLSAFENVAFPLRIRRTPEAAVGSTVERLLRSVQLAELGARKPHTLSGGQRHRFALARAMAARPSVLLLDEPLASLDPSLRQEVRDTLILLQNEYSPAVVLVTHDLEEAAALGHRIGILLGGRLVQTGAPEDLFRKPASLAVARFLGFPNLVPGQIAAGCFASPLGVHRLIQPMLGGPAVAGFRADALSEGDTGVEGRVVALRHGADRILASVAVGGVRVTYAPDPATVPQVDQAVRLVLNPELISLFPAEPDAG